MRRDAIITATACVSFFLGHALVWVDFFLSGETIHNETLWYFGQSLIYTGSALGISVYIKSKFESIYHQLNVNEHAKD